MDSKSIFILWHLGLGDAILCNGLVRWYAKLYETVKVPSYEHNFQSVSFMFSDLPNVQVVAVKDDAHAVLMAHGKNSLKLGYHSESGFNDRIFDQEFYRQAGVPFEQRWAGFRIPLMPISMGSEKEFSLVHHDPKRNFLIKTTEFNYSPVFVLPTKPFFSWADDIEDASEIHCINSSFMILVDSLPDRRQDLYFHHYARPTDFPSLRKNWKIISDHAKMYENDLGYIHA